MYEFINNLCILASNMIRVQDMQVDALGGVEGVDCVCERMRETWQLNQFLIPGLLLCDRPPGSRPLSQLSTIPPRFPGWVRLGQVGGMP